MHETLVLLLISHFLNIIIAVALKTIIYFFVNATLRPNNIKTKPEVLFIHFSAFLFLLINIATLLPVIAKIEHQISVVENIIVSIPGFVTTIIAATIKLSKFSIPIIFIEFIALTIGNIAKAELFRAHFLLTKNVQI